MATNGNNKDTIYVDIDDEITTIIDKVRGSDGRILALVLPKRAAVFQSIVNMKLLKRSADAAKKRIVLITSESSLMPLASMVGLHVAASLQSKPEIPVSAEQMTDAVDAFEDTSSTEGYTADTAGDRPVGELAASGSTTTATVPTEEVETLNLPDEELDKAATDVGSEKQQDQKPAKDKHLKVPNFNKFRARLFLVLALGIAMVVGLYACIVLLPKATIAITTNTTSTNVSLSPTLETSAQTIDVSKAIVPAKMEQQQKTTTQQVATTGQKNTGATASGTVTMSAGSCSGTQPQDVATGTGISTNSLTFITQDSASFSPVLDPHTHQCAWQSGTVKIAAQSPGAQYNVSNATFTVAGRSEITATGSATGGTDNVIQTVAQSDIDSAKQKLTNQDTNAAKSSLEQSLKLDGLYPIPITFNAGTPTITTSNNVGDQVNNLTVTQVITYTMFGAKQSDLEALIKSNIDSQINTNNQGILDDGLSGANIGVVNTSGGTVQLSLQTSATIGPDITVAEIKKQSAGKKVGDVKASINNIPGVTSVDVHLSPFWVGTVPSNVKQITVTISKAQQTTHGSG